MFSHQTPEIGFEPGQLSSLLIVAGVLLHVAINLKSLGSTTTIEVSDSDRETGTVKWFNVSKGFGFITRDIGEDVFVHYRAIRGEGHRTLSEGQRVEFIVVEKDKGLQAEDVIAAPRGH
ncbi:MAG: cold-shock protein [Endozoicomonas sp.]|uniref:cold-shock protein n=1 Tax=Endozoicomonas sp. TaxID=1892382 RepID=UPI003D9B95A4